jgi:hypothetical protein
LVNKLVLASATYKRDGMQPGFFDGFKNASMEKMLPPALKEAYLKASPDPKGLQAVFDRDVARMVAFKDIPDADMLWPPPMASKPPAIAASLLYAMEPAPITAPKDHSRTSRSGSMS